MGLIPGDKSAGQIVTGDRFRIYQKRKENLAATLGYFHNTTCPGLVLVTNDPLDTIAIETLVDSVPIGKQFSHYHGFAAAHASEGPASSLID